MPLDLVLKIIPEVLFSSLVIIVYLITIEITENRVSSVLAALMAAFIPLLIRETLNMASVYSLFLPLIFLA